MNIIRQWPSLRDNASLRQLFPIIVVFALSLIISALTGMGLGLGWQLFEIVVSIGFFLLLLILPGYFILRLLAARILDNETVLVLAIPTTLILLFIPFGTLYLIKADAGYITLAFWSGLVLILLIALKKGVILDFIPAVNTQRWEIIIVFATAVFSACYICAGIPSHDLSALDPVFIAQRKCFNFIPCADNSLQYSTAGVFIHHTLPWAAGGWTMGDRTPLMAVVNAFISFFTAQTFYSYKAYQLIGTLLNALFLWPCVLFVKRWFPGRFFMILVPLSVVFNPFIFFNVFYTWPKLFSAYFSMLAVFFMMRLTPSIMAAFITGILWSLAALSHSGAIMTLPVFLSAFSVNAIIRYGMRRYLVWGVFLLLSFATLQLPWHYYKKAYPSINTSLLFYLHYVPKEAFSPDTSGGQLSDAIHKFPSYLFNGQHLRHRFRNLKLLLATDISEYLKGCSDEEKKAYDTSFLPTFMLPSCAIGKWILLLFAAAAGWSVVRKRRLTLLCQKALWPWSPTVPPKAGKLATGSNGVLGFAGFRKACPSSARDLTCVAKATPAQQVAPREAAGCFTEKSGIQYHQISLEMACVMGLAILSYGLNTFLKWTLPHIHELPYMELILIIIIIHGVILSSNSLMRWIGVSLIASRFIYYLFAAFTYAG